LSQSQGNNEYVPIGLTSDNNAARNLTNNLHFVYVKVHFLIYSHLMFRNTAYLRHFLTQTSYLHEWFNYYFLTKN